MEFGGGHFPGRVAVDSNGTAAVGPPGSIFLSLRRGLLVKLWSRFSRRARTRQPENSKRAHFRAPALQTPPKFHERTPRERERRKKIVAGGGKKKREILGHPPFGAPPFGAQKGVCSSMCSLFCLFEKVRNGFIKIWMKVVNFIKKFSSKTTFIRTTLIKIHFHQEPFSSRTIFIKNHFHQKPLSSKTNFIKNQFHQKPLSSETTFIKNHFNQKPISSETTFIRDHFHQKTIFTRNHFHQKPRSSKTTFIKKPQTPKTKTPKTKTLKTKTLKT